MTPTPRLDRACTIALALASAFFYAFVIAPALAILIVML